MRDKELEHLREAWRHIVDMQKNVANAQACLTNLDLKLTGDHLKVAQWNSEQAKKFIKMVGELKNQTKTSR
jgi:hypothetical protein